MTNNYCFTGPRKISYAQGIQIVRKLAELGEFSAHVGDATGTDKVVWDFLQGRAKRLTQYKSEGLQAWQLAQRSQRMVDGCHIQEGEAKLIAFPNKACPTGVKPRRTFSGKGSGTWGTIAYAYYLEMDIELHWLEPGLSEPDWLKAKQLSLF